MSIPEIQKIDLSDVLASIADLGATNRPLTQESNFKARMKTIAGVTNYLLENDPSYRRAYKNHPLLLRQQKKWIAEQLQ